MHSGAQDPLRFATHGESAHGGHTVMRKPIILNVAITWSSVIAGLYIFSGVFALLAGKDALVSYIAADALGEAVSSSTLEQLAADPEIAAAVDEAYGTLAVKAVLVVAAGLLIGVFSWLARHAAAWARALVLVTTFLAMVPAAILLAENSALAINKILPTATWAATFFAVPLSFVVYVLYFLPPINRYARARK